MMSESQPFNILLLAAACNFLAGTVCVSADDLRVRLRDENGRDSEVWVYNDIPAAMAAAKRTGKPLFVTFRCVPCRDCAAFDADVANGNERVRELAANRFISVRQVEMKNVDLTQFQFDYDLNWAALFLNADGTVYARYGTQSAEGSDAYNSIEGLLATMQRVLELHRRYPANQQELADKRGKPRAVSDALQHPGLRNPAKYAQQTTRSNCIHCHNIHDAEHFHALQQGKWAPALLWKYPLPDQLGLRIDRISGVQISDVLAGSSAAAAGLVPGEDILRVNGQAITSVADIQWALNDVPDNDALITVEGSQSGLRQLRPAAGWRKADFSWRGSMWNAPPRLQVWLPELTAEQSANLGLPRGDSALEVRWINPEGPGGRQAQADGLREKDILVALDGKPIRMDSRQFNAHLKLHYRVGDRLPLTVLRDGRRLELSLLLVE